MMDVALDEGISSLIAGIYASVEDSSQWDRSVAALIRLTRSRFAFVATLDTRKASFPTAKFHGCDDSRFLDGIIEYEQHQYQEDLAIKFAVQNPNARMFDARYMCREQEYFKHPYLRWSVDRLGSAFWQTAYTPVRDDLTFGVALHGSRARGPLTDSETRLFLMLFDHMEQATRIAARPVSFSNNDEARLLIDARGEVRDVSPLARDLFDKNDGLSVSGRVLKTARREDQGRLDAIIASAVSALADGTSGGAVAIGRPSGRRDLIVRASPLPVPPPPFEALRPAALLRIIDPDLGPDDGSIAAWRAVFGLTAAECRLIKALITRGGTLRDASDDVGIAYSTARVHMNNALAKCEVRTQAQLTRLLERI